MYGGGCPTSSNFHPRSRGETPGNIGQLADMTIKPACLQQKHVLECLSVVDVAMFATQRGVDVWTNGRNARPERDMSVSYYQHV